jgi:glycosyltransferase involved in cell wall biosynthesis
MRIIVAHNFYQLPGGEDQVFSAEVDLLRRFGHEVQTFVLHNDAVNAMSRMKSLAATIWNRQSYSVLKQLVRRSRAQIVHFHNTFPLISPAGYKAARDEGAAVVQTLHNFRLISPCAVLFRKGQVCEKCLGRTFAWPGVLYGCYRQSRPATAAVAGMVAAHKLLGTWQNAVDVYIAPTPSARTKLIEGGLPADRIMVKPNFVDPDPGPASGAGGYAIFVGRLSHEKGLPVLLEAWRNLGPFMPLKIIGDGPLAPLVQEAAAQMPDTIQWLGQRKHEEVSDLIGEATFLVLPSQCYETFGRVAVEAFAKGTPVIASGHGAMADVACDGRTGMLFKPGDPHELAGRIRDLLRDPNALSAMRAAARREYESRYTGRTNHEQLMEVYMRALQRRPGIWSCDPEDHGAQVSVSTKA